MGTGTKTALAGAAVLLSATGHAMAQSRSSFLVSDGLGSLTITQEGALGYRVDLGAAPTMTYLGVTYTVNSVFGFWALSDLDNDFGGTTSFGTWDAHESLAGSGGITGWKTNPNQGIEPGESLLFTFDSLTLADVASFGMHIRVNETLPTGGNTAYFTVPGPASLSLLSAAAIVMPRRRR